ncbi:hypothetical protein [Streptomyces sp. BSE7-9]|nr:hypothetical protein [Streptomyces sp. BSE7-9]
MAVLHALEEEAVGEPVRGFTGYYQRHDEGPIGYRGTEIGLGRV